MLGFAATLSLHVFKTSYLFNSESESPDNASKALYAARSATDI